MTDLRRMRQREPSRGSDGDGVAGGPGGIFHWVTHTEDGLQITDVWESKDAFERFAEAQLRPHTAAVGITEPPEFTYYEVHNYLTAGPVAA